VDARLVFVRGLTINNLHDWAKVEFLVKLGDMLLVWCLLEGVDGKVAVQRQADLFLDGCRREHAALELKRHELNSLPSEELSLARFYTVWLLRVELPVEKSLGLLLINHQFFYVLSALAGQGIGTPEWNQIVKRLIEFVLDGGIAHFEFLVALILLFRFAVDG
jgi:hypothetical protein